MGFFCYERGISGGPLNAQTERKTGKKKKKVKKRGYFPSDRFDHPSRLLCAETFTDFGKCLFKTSSEEMIKAP